jgi:hypothetical protein
VSTFQARPLGARVASAGAAATSGGAGRSAAAAVAPSSAKEIPTMNERFMNTTPLPATGTGLVNDFRRCDRDSHVRPKALREARSPAKPRLSNGRALELEWH